MSEDLEKMREWAKDKAENMKLMSKERVYAFIPARNEAKHLPATLKALQNQTVKPYKITLIDDGSADLHSYITEDFDGIIIRLPSHRESYTARPDTWWKMAKVLNHAFPVPKGCRYMLQLGADTVLPKDYIEILISRMEKDKRLVITSGQIKGEPNLRGHVRGSGRLYKVWFWKRFVKRFPESVGYESYPLYKALSLGLKIESYPDLQMKVSRSTRIYKTKYGMAMRILGYFPPFALLKCFLTILSGGQKGINITISYLFPPVKRGWNASDISRWIKHHQIHRLLHFKESVEIWINRILGSS